MGYYWKQGLLMGLAVGLTLHFLILHLSSRTPLSQGNIPLDRPSQSLPVNRHTTPLGPLMGLTIFALCCVMPGPQAARVGS